MTVTWGPSTVHNIGTTAAPAAPTTTFGAAPSAPLAFGSPSPAASTGIFGSSAPAPSLFGSPTPAPGGSIFGAPASGGLFGAPASPAPSSTAFGFSTFGSTQQQPQQQQQQQFAQQQIPAQAALQAHLDASARQEEARVQQKLQHIQNSYTGASTATETTSASFATILYNPLTREVQQQQWLQGMPLDGKPRPMAHPRPLQVSERDWDYALVRNPDYTQYMPIAVVGAEALQARLTYQQEMANQCQQQIQIIGDTHATVSERFQDALVRVHQLQHKRDLLRKRLLAVMRKVEIARCYNMPLQTDEMQAMDALARLQQHADHLKGVVTRLAETIQIIQQPQQMQQPAVADKVDEKKLLPIVQNHRLDLTNLSEIVKKDRRDLKLIQERVEQLRPGMSK